MTREEIENSKAYQVSKAALEYYNEHYQDNDIDLCDAFEAGAEWDEVFNDKELLSVARRTAEKTKKEFIKRACEWLENRHNIEKSLGILTSRTEDLSKAFKQAMEECL